MKEWLASLPPIPVSTLLLVLLLAVLLGYFVFLAWRSWKRLDELELKDRFAARNDFIKTTAQILGGAFFLITIYFTYQNLALSQKNLVATQEKNITDLYTKAIEQLGNKESLEVRLGGIYALERIARESEKDHWPIMEVLTTYVRERSLKQKPIVDKTTNILEIEPPSDIQSILTIIGRRGYTYKNGEDNRLNLNKSYLIGANLKSAHLEGAELKGATLIHARLDNANLNKAMLHDAHFEWAVFFKAFLDEADFRDASLINATLQDASLRKANLESAKLQNAFLLNADLTGAKLNHAHLEGANLTGVKGLTKLQLETAKTDANTILPKHYSPHNAN